MEEELVHGGNTHMRPSLFAVWQGATCLSRTCLRSRCRPDSARAEGDCGEMTLRKSGAKSVAASRKGRPVPAAKARPARSANAEPAQVVEDLDPGELVAGFIRDYI